MNRIMRWSVVWIVVLGLMSSAQTTVQLMDQTGTVVEITQPVERFASVYGIGTYYAYALGVSEMLVKGWFIGAKNLAQASDSLYRLEPRLERVLSSGDPNIEELVATGAQLIFADGSRHSAFAAQISELGVGVIQFLVETPEALKEAMLLAAVPFGADAMTRAGMFAADYDRVLDAIQSDLEDSAPVAAPRVLFLGTDALTVASGDMYQSWLIEAAGGLSVSSSLQGHWNDVNLEQILVWNPEVIVIPPYGPVQPATILENPDWQAISAVQTGRVHRMPRIFAPMDTPVPESMLGIVWLAELLHPDVMGFDLEEEMSRFYAFYYGYELQEDELTQLMSK